MANLLSIVLHAIIVSAYQVASRCTLSMHKEKGRTGEHRAVFQWLDSG